MTDERRRYFRIEDNVSFTVTAIDQGEVQAQIDLFWNDQKAYALRHQFNHQLEQHLADFRMIEKNTPELARYLTVLQTQLNSLTAKIIPEQTSVADDTQKVNLSAQGMAFMAEQKLTVGDTIELNLKLLSTGQILKIFAEVVDVEQVSGQFRISLDFAHIYESDQDLLVKRIHARQLQDIAAARSIDS